jgi:hypothetical protein
MIPTGITRKRETVSTTPLLSVEGGLVDPSEVDVSFPRTNCDVVFEAVVVPLVATIIVVMTGPVETGTVVLVAFAMV